MSLSVPIKMVPTPLWMWMDFTGVTGVVHMLACIACSNGEIERFCTNRRNSINSRSDKGSGRCVRWRRCCWCWIIQTVNQSAQDAMSTKDVKRPFPVQGHRWCMRRSPFVCPSTGYSVGTMRVRECDIKGTISMTLKIRWQTKSWWTIMVACTQIIDARTSKVCCSMTYRVAQNSIKPSIIIKSY